MLVSSKVNRGTRKNPQYSLRQGLGVRWLKFSLSKMYLARSPAHSKLMVRGAYHSNAMQHLQCAGNEIGAWYTLLMGQVVEFKSVV